MAAGRREFHVVFDLISNEPIPVLTHYLSAADPYFKNSKDPFDPFQRRTGAVRIIVRIGAERS
jgi:hypothetical protein